MTDTMPPYPADPLTEQQIKESTLTCISGPDPYKAYSDKLCSSCGKDKKTPIAV